jgi:hypothetical protein
MLAEEIKTLVGSENYDASQFENPGRIIGIICDGGKPEPVRVIEEETDDQCAKGFLMLGAGAMQAAAAGVSRIGLSLAHSFPRTVEGTLGAVVRNEAQSFLLSANHIIWMNGWASEGTRIVLHPFDSPPYEQAGQVYSGNDPLLGGGHINTTQEIALGLKDESFSLPAAAKTNPGSCAKGDTLYHLRHTGELHSARVRSMDFRLSLRFEFGRFLFSQQILLEATTEFAARGDSGGLLFRKDKTGFTPVAMLWAGMPDSGVRRQSCVAAPLSAYFAKHRLKFEGYREPKVAAGTEAG